MYKCVDEYIDQFSGDRKDKLIRLRLLIKSKLVNATEIISWKMPTYREKHNLIHFALHQNHIGIYPGPEVVELLKDELKDYKVSKGSIQIPIDKELPMELLNKIIDTVISLKD
jgi:uncharacterized protein YdhG (YjbR/CyaY superfamily)